MFIAMSMIPAGDVAGKLLSSAHDVAPAFVAWSRFAIGVLLVVRPGFGGSAGLGWAVFGDLPDALTWAGLVLVITAGLSSAALRR